MSKFLNNQVVDDGAAIFIDFENIEVVLEKCEFISNKAGVNPFGVGLTITGFPIGLYVPSVHGYEKLSENSIKLYLETLDMSSTSSINESVNLDIRGSGAPFMLILLSMLSLVTVHLSIIPPITMAVPSTQVSMYTW